MIVEDTGHRFVSDAEKAVWNSKANGSHSHSNYVLLGDTLQNTNPFGGRQLYINTLDNVLAAANKKYFVTVTLHKKVVNSVTYPKAINASNITLPQWEDSPIVATPNVDLFNNNYEGGLYIPTDSYAKIRLDFNSAGTSYFAGYPYGTYYLSYYHTYTPDKAQVRCYNGFAAHGIGYKTLNFTDYIGNNGGSSYIQQCTDSGNYSRREIEFIVFGHPSHSTTLTQIEWKLQRPNFASNTPIFSNYGPNKSYNIFTFGDQTNDNVTIYPSGNIVATKFIGNASSATKLETAKTIEGVAFDGTKNVNIITVGTTQPTSGWWFEEI